MPLYEYQCESCGHRFELIRKFSDPPLAACPKCGGPVRKLVSSPAIQFKGSGFYITDYAKSGSGGGKPKSDGDKAESADKAADKAKTSEKSDAKSESKSDSSSSTGDASSKPKSDAPAKPD